MELTNKEMQNVSGGIGPISIVSIALTAVAFIVGILSGITNPTKCN